MDWQNLDVTELGIGGNVWETLYLSSTTSLNAKHHERLCSTILFFVILHKLMTAVSDPEIVTQCQCFLLPYNRVLENLI